MLRPTWAEVDLSAIEKNYLLLKGLVNPETAIMAVIKADAYGNGSVAAAKDLEQLGIPYLGVSSLDEALQLREAEIETPLLILGSVLTDLHQVS